MDFMQKLHIGVQSAAPLRSFYVNWRRANKRDILALEDIVKHAEYAKWTNERNSLPLKAAA